MAKPSVEALCGSQDGGDACPVCAEAVGGELGAHLRAVHGEEAFRRAVLVAKEGGMPDAQIGVRFGLSFNKLQQIATEAYGANISVLKRPKRIKRWQPPDFHEETTTVWSFRRRGDWATHDGRYRGNWSPYIPRNVILKYSRPGDLVLDYFVGGGTTAVEAKLLGRRCIARDINPGAVGITLENLEFDAPPQVSGDGALRAYEPQVSVGDARHLSGIRDGTVDLICAHPPYAGIIKYGTDIPGDLSDLSVEDFLVEMGKVARESLRVLRPGGRCAILIGDARKSRHVVPIGFRTIRAFLDAGFALNELVVKRQHNCKTTGFWHSRSVQHNFLLLAHEYLPIFGAPTLGGVSEQPALWDYAMPHGSTVQTVPTSQNDEMETTTVWILPLACFENEIRRNLLTRFAAREGEFVETVVGSGATPRKTRIVSKSPLVYVAPPGGLASEHEVGGYCSAVRLVAEEAAKILPDKGFFVVDTKDMRIRGGVVPMGAVVLEALSSVMEFAIREVVVVVPDGASESASGESLDVVHRYLLIFERR